MRLIIEIPKEFEAHFADDRFKNSLERLQADAHLLAGNYERELADMLIDAFYRAEGIRCGECRHCYNDGDEYTVVNRCELDHPTVQSDDWICADGERKEDETNRC